MAASKPHPNDGDLYTPLTPQLVDLFWHMRDVHGTWRDVSYLTGTKLKVLRDMRDGTRKTISLTKLDEMITATECGDLRDFVWFTPADLIRLGIWDDFYARLEEYKAENAKPRKRKTFHRPRTAE